MHTTLMYTFPNVSKKYSKFIGTFIVKNAPYVYQNYSDFKMDFRKKCE